MDSESERFAPVKSIEYTYVYIYTYIYIYIYIYKRVDKTDALLPTKPVPCIHDG